MSFKPEASYDAERKIWNGKELRYYFSPELSIGEIIFHEMRRHPHLIAQISDSENTILTREELHLNSMRVASYLRSLGLQQSDTVGIIARNTTHLSAVAYGCFFNGIAFQAMNVIYDQATIEEIFDITKPRVIFCDGEDYEKVKASTANLDVKIVTMRNHQMGSISIEEVLATPVEQDFEPARLEQGNNQTLAIVSSSGSTGIPKAVTISNSHKILYTGVDLTTEDVMYAHTTLDWLSGVRVAVISGVFSTKLIIADCPFDPARVIRLIEKYKVTWLMQAPSHLALTASCPEFDEANLQSIRTYRYGGGRCSLETQQKIRRKLPHACLNLVYGLSELGSSACQNFHFDEKPNSVGRVMDGFKLKVLDEGGHNLGPNEVGEICVYSSDYWAGYYGNPEETRAVRDSDLWFHTGDLGYVDDDGFLYIVERKKEMLKYRSYIYYPHEVENIIAQIPDVREVCVFGIWNEVNGDEAAAAVVRRPGSDIDARDVVDYVTEHCEAKYKHLHGGAIIVDDLKRTANGKTNRQATKAYFLQVKGRN